MAGGEISKVVRLQLKYLYDDEKKQRYPYEELKTVQQLVSRAKNRTVQACWELNNMQVAFKNVHGVYPEKAYYLGKYKTVDGFVYDKLKDEFYQMYSINLNCAIRDACKAFSSAKSDMQHGVRSVMSYRADCPISIHNQYVRLHQEKQKYYVSMGVFSTRYIKEKNYASPYMDFELYRLGGAQQAIVNRCISGEYKIGESDLIYNEKKHCWFLNLTYKFVPRPEAKLDPEKIMGVDLGICCVAYMGFTFCKDRFFIGRSEVEAFRTKMEARKKALQEQGKYCGDGRIGHGYATRTKPVWQISDAISRFRDTANHRYSHYIVQKAVDLGCGVIQMENLKDIKGAKESKVLRDWTYFDLRTKIINKAQEQGIEVRLVDPRYTSQRCSQCGHIDKANRPKEEKGQAFFQCMECGYRENADYNAALNLATRDIDKIIAKETSAKGKRTEKS